MNYDAVAINALEAVMMRREMVVVDKANGGDPDAFRYWTSELAQTSNNYGQDFFGGLLGPLES